MHDRWAECKKFMLEHLRASISLRDLGRVTGLNPDYLCRAFKRDVGMTPHEYLVHLRVHRARRLLERGERPVDVAIDVGFTDQSHLTRHFKRYFGTTPAQFQRGLRPHKPTRHDAPPARRRTACSGSCSYRKGVPTGGPGQRAFHDPSKTELPDKPT